MNRCLVALRLRDTKSRMQILVEQKQDGAVAEAKGRGGREGREPGLPSHFRI